MLVKEWRAFQQRGGVLLRNTTVTLNSSIQPGPVPGCLRQSKAGSPAQVEELLHRRASNPSSAGARTAGVTLKLLFDQLSQCADRGLAFRCPRMSIG